MSDERVTLILSEEPVPRFTILPKRPAARAGIAIVYSTTGGGYELVKGRATPSRSPAPSPRPRR